MPRKGENIYKRKDKRWEGRYIKCRDENSRAVYGYVYGKSYLEVKNKLKNCKPAQPKPDEEATILFSESALQWYDFKKNNVKPSSSARYNTILQNHLLPVFGDKTITEINTMIIQEFIEHLQDKDLSAKTITDILCVLKSVLKFSCKNKSQLNIDFADISVKNMKPEIKTMTENEQRKLAIYLESNLCFKNFCILLCMYTGIRIGELCALKWSDIDFNDKLLTVNKTMLRIPQSDNENIRTSVIISSPKSDDSIRVIPVPDLLIKIASAFSYSQNAYILTGNEDKYIEPRGMQYYFKSVLKKCGIQDYKYHALRHTFATNCVESGFEIKSLSEILGHSSIKITLDRYVHSSMKLKRENMAKLNIPSIY